MCSNKYNCYCISYFEKKECKKSINLILISFQLFELKKRMWGLKTPQISYY